MLQTQILNSWLERFLFGALKYKITDNACENEETISFYVEYEKIFMSFFANKLMEQCLLWYYIWFVQINLLEFQRHFILN